MEENIGFKGLADIKRAVEATGKQVVLVDNGDAVQGGTIGTLSDGKYIIDIMNKLGYAAATPGNHEFDYSVETFFALTEAADFPYISANFADADGKLRSKLQVRRFSMLWNSPPVRSPVSSAAFSRFPA